MLEAVDEKQEQGDPFTLPGMTPAFLPPCQLKPAPLRYGG